MKNKLEEQQTSQHIDTALCPEKSVSQQNNTIDENISLGIAVMNKLLKTEPYLQKGILYTSNNKNNVFAYYKIPENTGPEEEIFDPIIKIIGTDIMDCLRETAITLEANGESKKSWELYAIEQEDYETIKKTIGKEICTLQGLQLSLHRTPIKYLIEKNTPAQESRYRHLRLEALKRNILKRHEQTNNHLNTKKQ